VRRPEGSGGGRQDRRREKGSKREFTEYNEEEYQTVCLRGHKWERDASDSRLAQARVDHHGWRGGGFFFGEKELVREEGSSPRKTKGANKREEPKAPSSEAPPKRQRGKE